AAVRPFVLPSAVLGVGRGGPAPVSRRRGRRHTGHRHRLLLRRSSPPGPRAHGSRVSESVSLHDRRARGGYAADDGPRVCVGEGGTRRGGWGPGSPGPKDGAGGRLAPFRAG